MTDQELNDIAAVVHNKDSTGDAIKIAAIALLGELRSVRDNTTYAKLVTQRGKRTIGFRAWESNNDV